MDCKPPNGFMIVFESIVANPLHATFTVGGSILLLQALIHRLSPIWPPMDYLTYFIPFVPPFFITRTAKRISERKCFVCEENTEK